MMHWKGQSKILYCKKCNKKTKHEYWKHEVPYKKKYLFGLLSKTLYGLEWEYKCLKCNKGILWKKNY
jgi:hypothetical protein